MKFHEELKWRGLIHQETAGTEQHLDGEGLSVYAGFDPTADSLHVGSLMPLITLRRFKKAGFTTFGLIGGGTGLIGDPSGRSAERNLSSLDEVSTRQRSIIQQMAEIGVVDRLVNNATWLKELRLLDFLRDIGKSFSLNDMLSKDSVAHRRETGISFTEFSYMLLQAYDFLHLAKREKCMLQIGGSDQWGNITAGIDLIRKELQTPAFGLTLPLITTANGQKFGKTAEGAIWLDPVKTPPYTFYQFWLNTDDKDVIRFLKYFTFLEVEEIEDLERSVRDAPAARKAQKRLAWELTSLVHGYEPARRAKQASGVLFDGEPLNSLDLLDWRTIANNVPGISITLVPTVSEALIATGLVKSKAEAGREIVNGGIYLNQERVSDHKAAINTWFCGKFALLRRGKKNYACVELKQ